MTTVGLILILILGFMTGYLIVAIPKSIYIPKSMWIQAITLWNKPYAYIENVNGKKFYTGDSFPGRSKWDLIDDPDNKKSGWNVHFFLWPFCKAHEFEISYTKIIKPGEEKNGDVILRKKQGQNGEILDLLILRTRMTNHLMFRESYPMITTSLSTMELANINTVTLPVLEILNPSKALFGVSNWLQASIGILNAALRGFVATKELYTLNSISSEGGSRNFDEGIKLVADKTDPLHPGLGNLGIKLFKYAFEDYDPADEKAKQLMSSYTDVIIISQAAEANIKKADGEYAVMKKLADGKAYAHTTEQSAIIAMEKKKLIDTGHAKADDKGEINELVPDANVKAGTDALKELSKVKGTLILGGDIPQTMFNVGKNSN
jgi:hypothetical protein